MNADKLLTSNAPPAGAADGGRMAAWLIEWGALLMDAICAIGDLALFTQRTLYWIFARAPRKSALLAALYQVGVLSLPVVALTGTFIGMVLAVQSYYQFSNLGLETRLGAVVNMTLVRELGPVLAATMLAGRVGSAMSAEIGTMRVTEQIDALASMGANPIHYLVAPRLIACVTLIPALTIMADFMGVAGGYFYSVQILDIDKHHYWFNSQEYVGAFDILSGVIKSVFFGGVIAIISCYRGFYSTAGAEGVGRAATAAFVYSFVLIMVLDLFLGIILNHVQTAFWPSAAKLL